MQDFEKLGAFYLGRIYNPATRKASEDVLLYDSKDLVTHAVCVGMTGSGKTGLCIDLLEEAAIDGVPAIVIDPKGDIANLLLQFPELRPEDFRPWVNEEDARQQGVPVEQFAANLADTWRNGLASWGQGPERIAKLQSSAEFALYTPGSSAGLPISVLKSFSPPAAEVLEDRESFRDQVSGTASAILSLLGVSADSMQSREHILLSNILSSAWEDGRTLSLEELIHQIQTPPISKVGVLDIEAFYPAKDRFALAMSLNNLLASPGFEAWLEGEPLDIGKLLYTATGKPRISILSIAHLNDSERMFLVTLLLNEVLTWTRRQSGTTSLRAIVYMDEIFGYFPPVANPPSKRPLLTLLKQARAFGVGMVLATQNPVDLDYKGLANTGTWFIGRLQAERDKQRLLEGLEGAAGSTGGSFDRGAIEEMLAGLGKRVFLMNNVHESAPVLFESRWALSYLRGPLTRAQIKTLISARKSGRSSDTTEPLQAAFSASPQMRPAARASGAADTQRPVLPPDVPAAFLPVRGSDAEIVYYPMLMASAQIRFVDAKARIDHLEDSVFLTPIKDDSLPVQWEESTTTDLDPSELESTPVEGAGFAKLPAAAAKAKSYAAWQKDFVAWAYGHRQLQVFRCETLKACSQPNESEGSFRVRIQQSGREERDRAVEKLRQKYSTKIASLQDRLRKAQQAVQREREQSQSRAMETMVSVGTGVFGALFGRKRLSTAASGALRSAGRIRKESSDVGRAEENVESLAQQLDDLQAQVDSEIQSVQTQYEASSSLVEAVAIKPKKANINVRLFSLVWAPYRKEGGESKPAWE